MLPLTGATILYKTLPAHPIPTKFALDDQTNSQERERRVRSLLIQKLAVGDYPFAYGLVGDMYAEDGRKRVLQLAVLLALAE